MRPYKCNPRQTGMEEAAKSQDEEGAMEGYMQVGGLAHHNPRKRLSREAWNRAAARTLAMVFLQSNLVEHYNESVE